MRKTAYYLVFLILVCSFISGCANTFRNVGRAASITATGVGKDTKDNWVTLKRWGVKLHEGCANTFRNVGKAASATAEGVGKAASATAEGAGNGIKHGWATVKKWDANFKENWW